MWFIGLVFKKTESLNIDLTQDIQAFTGQGICSVFKFLFLRWIDFNPPNFSWKVHRQAATAKTVKDGRRIDAKHVKRKQLSSYLPSNFLLRTKRVVSRKKIWKFDYWIILNLFCLFLREECPCRLQLAVYPTERLQWQRLHSRERGRRMQLSMPSWWRKSEQENLLTGRGTWRLDQHPSPSWCCTRCQRFLEIHPTWSFHKILSGPFPIYLTDSVIVFFFKF